MRDDFIATQETTLVNLARSLADGGLTLRRWESEVQERLTRMHTAAYLAARGGRNAMTDADRRAIRKIVNDQRRYLRKFAEKIADGNMTAAQIERRVVLYARSARQSFERGRAAAFRVRLPAYPADGSAPCLVNDKCHWELVDKPDEVWAYWRLGVAEHCDTCVDRARRWAPYKAKRR